MFKKLFGFSSGTATMTKESLEQELENFQSETIVEREVITITEQPKIINSKVIQESIDATFAQVLKTFELDQSKESDIEDLKAKLEGFKKENEAIYKKVEQLNSLGFVNTPTAKVTLDKLKKQESKVNGQIAEINSEIKSNKVLQDQIKEYKLLYPTFKFIDNATMIAIMKKYDLWLGETFMYSREIPDRALGIISGFSKEIKDSEETMQIYTDSYRGMVMHSGVTVKAKPKAKKDVDPYEQHIWSPHSIMSESHRRVEFEVAVTKLKMIAPMSHFEIPTIELRNRRSTEISITPIAVLNPTTRRFELSAKQVEDFRRATQEVLDPIACLEVDGGFIILDAWDKEADIPEIKNQLLN